MTTYDVTSAAAGARARELRDQASASRLAARAACARAGSAPSLAGRVRTALHLERACD